MSSTIVNGSHVIQLTESHANEGKLRPASAKGIDVAKGRLGISHTLSDILFHTCDAEELHPISISCVRSSELTVGLLLEGQLEFSLNGEPIALKVAPGEKALAFAFNIMTHTEWKRSFIAHNHVKKILFTLPHEWISKVFLGNSEIDLFIQHLILQHGSGSLISEKVDDKLENLIKTLFDINNSKISAIELEGLALTSIAKIIQCLKPQSAHYSLSSDLRNQVNADALKICQYIEKNILYSNPPIQINLKTIAKQLCMSVSTAQRIFKREFKQTIMDYIKMRRLEIARRQLQRNMSIGEASYLAGYTHVANFSLAFKKHFGISPGEAARS